MRRLFSWIFPRDVDGSYSSELNEAYQLQREKSGPIISRLWLYGQILSILVHSLRIGVPSAMLFFSRSGKSALRQLRTNSGYSILNVAGLATGLVAFILIFLFASYETSFDSFHSEYDRIYRVNRLSIQAEMGSSISAQTQGMLGETMVRTFPEVDKLVRVRNQFQETLLVNENAVRLDTGLMVDSTFFDVFDFKLAQGDRQSALGAPFSILMTEDLAIRLFGTPDVIGRTVEFGQDAIPLTVTGIVVPAPLNSHLQFDYLISWSTSQHPEGAQYFGNYNNWLTLQMGTYITLVPGASTSQVDARFDDVMDEFLADRKHRYLFYLQPLSEIHVTGSSTTATLDPYPGNRQLIRMLIAVGFLILCIAYVNFVNLSTARASQRAREVGVRKAIGATRAQLIGQFVSESIFMSGAALLLSIAIVAIIRPLVSNVIARPLPIPAGGWLLLVGLCFATLAVSALAAGLYPAIVLSRFHAGDSKTKVTSYRGQPMLRHVLVTAQFCASLVLIIGTLVVFRQTAFMENKELGFDSEQLIQMPISPSIVDGIDAVKRELLSHPQISAVSTATSGPTLGAWGMDYKPVAVGGDEFLNLRSLGISENWFQTHGIGILEGPSTADVFAQGDDETRIYINETLRDELVNTWGLSEVIGQQLMIGSRDRELATIAGVVEDFHLRSVNQEIPPLIIWGANWGSLMAVRMSTASTGSAIGHLESVWKKFETRMPFEYWFVDEAYQKFYEGDRRLMSILGAFATLAVAIALLGLFGLTAYSAEQRKSEIGIRKVLGATEGSIIFLLGKSFSVLAIASVFIAIPIAYFGAASWLHAFPYRIPLTGSVFVVGALVMLSVALLTVIVQAYRAASARPAEIIST